MEKISLAQLLRYYELEGYPEWIQIVSGNQDWDNADEMSFDSVLLKPFSEWKVQYLKTEKSYRSGKPIIRVSIRKEEDSDDSMVVADCCA